jgi:Fe-S oxidoreductase
MRETMALCISCKGCKRECPTGVDMARMKIEFLRHYRRSHALSLRERLVAYLPRYAPVASRLAPLLNLRNRVPGLRALSEKLLGFSAARPLPRWDTLPYRDPPTSSDWVAREAVLFVDTFNRWFEPENARAAERVLRRGGYTVRSATPRGERPLCCGRTFLAVGLVDEAKAEARRLVAAMKPFVERGAPIIGLEPSCLLTLRDEIPALLPSAEAEAVAARAELFEEFIAEASTAGRFKLAAKPRAGKALLHGHCHQKAFNLTGTSLAALKLVPGLEVETFDSTCCGMAGVFGYEAEHHDMSLKIGELGVLPKMRNAAADTLLVAAGTSCRHQIADGAGRIALHPARVLDEATS